MTGVIGLGNERERGGKREGEELWNTGNGMLGDGKEEDRRIGADSGNTSKGQNFFLKIL